MKSFIVSILLVAVMISGACLCQTATNSVVVLSAPAPRVSDETSYLRSTYRELVQNGSEIFGLPKSTPGLALAKKDFYAAYALYRKLDAGKTHDHTMLDQALAVVRTDIETLRAVRR